MLRRNIVHSQIAASAGSCWMKLALVVAWCIAIAGCGGEDWHAETYPSRGRLMINGEPAGGAIVELHSTGASKPDVRNSRPWAVVQEDGTYTLSTYEQGDGAPPGEYAVIVRWPPDVNQPSLVDRLGGAYTRPDRSKWHVTITEGENELPAVEITGAKVLPKNKVAAVSKRPPGPAMGK